MYINQYMNVHISIDIQLCMRKVYGQRGDILDSERVSCWRESGVWDSASVV